MTLSERLFKVRDHLTNWWENGDQKHPLVLASCPREESLDIPDTDDLNVFWQDIDFIIARQMALIDNSDYYGAALPYHFIDHGSSAMSCALGAKLQLLNKETIWAHPILECLEAFTDLHLDENHPVYHHILQLTRRSAKLAPDHHFIAHFPLQGVMDMIADLYGTEQLLMDMLVQPDKVGRAAEHAKTLWMQGFHDINAIVETSKNTGGIGWAGVWAPGTTFPIQEDFSYMISKKMFDQFCLPHICDMVDAMDYPFYHLDGTKAIQHLDSLLKIDKLKAIQWQPGAGHEALHQWYELVQKILVAGKSVQLYGRPEEIEELVKHVGAKGVLVICRNLSNSEGLRLLEKYPLEG